MLAGCASPSGMHGAQARLTAFNDAQGVLNITAPGAADERIAIGAAMPAVRACDATYEAGMRALWTSRPTELVALQRVDALDEAFSACLQPAGLAGRHEMQVEGRFLPMPEYVAQGFALGRQANTPQATSGLGDVLGAIAVGRAMQTPAPAPAMPVNCQSIRVGASVSTTCR